MNKDNIKAFFVDNRRLIIILSVIVIGIALIAYYGLRLANSTNESYQNLDDGKPKDKQSEKDHKNVYDKKNMSVLLLGKDKPSEGSKDVRTDSIILATYNSDSNDVKMVRIPRDMYIEYKGYKGKINGVYQALGVKELKHVVEDYTGVPVTNYVTTDFSGLSKIVDSIDGVDVNSKIVIDDSNNDQVGKDVHITKGKHTLNGKEALAYSRIRYIDNDIERGKRQEEVIKGIAEKLMSPSELPHAQDNIETISKYVNTDINPSKMMSYVPKASDKPKIDTITFNWSAFDYQGESFVYLTDAERHKISDQLRKHLNINTLTKLKDMVLKPKGAQTNTADDDKPDKSDKSSDNKNKDSDKNKSDDTSNDNDNNDSTTAGDKDKSSQKGANSASRHDTDKNSQQKDYVPDYDGSGKNDEAGLKQRIHDRTQKSVDGQDNTYKSNVKEKDDNAGINIIPEDMR